MQPRRLRAVYLQMEAFITEQNFSSAPTCMQPLGKRAARLRQASHPHHTVLQVMPERSGASPAASLNRRTNVEIPVDGKNHLEMTPEINRSLDGAGQRLGCSDGKIDGWAEGKAKHERVDEIRFH